MIRLLFSASSVLSLPFRSRIQDAKLLLSFFGSACYIFDIIAVINIIVFPSFCSVLLDLRDDLVLPFDANGIMRISTCHVR